MTNIDDEDKDIDAEELPRAIDMPSHETLVSQVAILEAQLEEHTQKLLRAHADMENTRRRAKLDVQEAHQFGLKKYMIECLPVLDSLEQALALPMDDMAAASAMRHGVEMTFNLFLKILGKFSVEVLNPEGDPFNPDFHNAVQTVEDANYASGIVLKVLQKGYTLQGRLLRPAMVVIVK